MPNAILWLLLALTNALGAPVSVEKGLHRRKLGTTTRRGGARQVTYAGHPLYYHVGDRKPGQILCQNVVEFGGTWLVSLTRRPRGPRRLSAV
jgi:Secreted repeat of unknown function